MSVEAMTWVFKHSPTRGTDRLVLLVIADHAAEHESAPGVWQCWPGVARIAEMANVSHRTAQDTLTRLAAAGHIARDVNAAPDSRMRRDRRTNVYRIVTERGAVSPHPVDIHSPEDGVLPDRTPSDLRGVASQHPVNGNGVLSDDATGCGDTAPKSLVEPMGDTALHEPRANGPSGAVGNEDQQQSSGAEGRRELIRAACRVIAERRAELQPRPVAPAWVSTTAGSVFRAHEGSGHRLVLEAEDAGVTLTAADLADLLTAPRGAASAAITQRRIRDTLARPGDVVRSQEHAAALLASLRRPHDHTEATCQQP